MRNQIFKQPAFIPIFANYQFLKGKTVGITGSSGVLGRILKSRLEFNKIDVSCYEEDILDAARIHRWFKISKFDYLIHFAAIVPVKEVERDPIKAFKINSIGTFNLCEALVSSQRKCRVFLASTSHVYECRNSNITISEDEAAKPCSTYGKTKLLAEQIASSVLTVHNVPYCIGRIFSFSSPLQSEPYLVPSIISKIKKAGEKGTIEIVNPDSIRDIMDAESVIDCILHIITKKFDGIINIGSGYGMSIKEIVLYIAELLERNIYIKGKMISTPDSLIANIDRLRSILEKE